MNNMNERQSKAISDPNRMYRIRIYETDAVRLLRRCELCSGEVFMKMQDGSLSSLKTNTFMRLAFRTMTMPSAGVELLLTDAGDLTLFLEYLSGVWTAAR